MPRSLQVNLSGKAKLVDLRSIRTGICFSSFRHIQVLKMFILLESLSVNYQLFSHLNL